MALFKKQSKSCTPLSRTQEENESKKASPYYINRKKKQYRSFFDLNIRVTDNVNTSDEKSTRISNKQM